MFSQDDIHFMRYALSMARRGLGRTAPNPSVGCVIVKNNCIIAAARTADGGRPHAEAQALQDAGVEAKGATIYVTLEPCAHHGKTPPCIDAIIKAGPARVVIGVLDINPVVNGKGVEALKAAGISVTIGVLEAECRKVVSGFFRTLNENRPHISLKTACTIDGKIAMADGQSKWITGALARKHVHGLRARHDAILVGAGTVIADNPDLRTRFDGIDHNSIRIVLGSENYQIPHTSRLFETASAQDPVWIYGQANKDQIRHDHIKYFDCHNIYEILKSISQQGVTRLLVEGGPKVVTSFFKAGLWDEIYIYRAPFFLGSDARPALEGIDLQNLSDRYELDLMHNQKLGKDSLEIYTRRG